MHHGYYNPSVAPAPLVMQHWKTAANLMSAQEDSLCIVAPVIAWIGLPVTPGGPVPSLTSDGFSWYHKLLHLVAKPVLRSTFPFNLTARHNLPSTLVTIPTHDVSVASDGRPYFLLERVYNPSRTLSSIQFRFPFPFPFDFFILSFLLDFSSRPGVFSFRFLSRSFISLYFFRQSFQPALFI